jgi:Na+/H+-dicarboxylate symporter
VLPLAVSTFKISMPISWITGAVFLGRLYGVPLSFGAIVTLAISAVVMSFSTPGIPSGSLLIMAPFLGELGLPSEGIGILIALDMFPDMFKTTANVTGDLAVATIVARVSNAPVRAPPPVYEARQP